MHGQILAPQDLPKARDARLHGQAAPLPLVVALVGCKKKADAPAGEPGKKEPVAAKGEEPAREDEGARPAAEILEPLQRLVQDVAQHQGKLVKLELEGADTRLDHGTLDVLAEPLRRLVWLAVAHGIERPVQRREAGKPIVGRVSVAVTRMPIVSR